MEDASKILYGSFPRTVASSKDGELRQYFVHSEGEFDLFFNEVRADRNVYSSTCRFRNDMRPILDKVIFDFDSPLKESAFRSDIPDKQKIDMMREDEDLAYEVLGEVWEDTQNLVLQCVKEDIPVLSVFSGMGVHCHILYQDEVSPKRRKITTSNYFIDECDLNTHDTQVIPDTRRVLRVPNSQRIDRNGPTGVWTIPMSEYEVVNNDIIDVLNRCSSPKSLKNPDRYSKDIRPEMEIKEGYENDEEDRVGTVELEDRDIDAELDFETEWIVKECIGMPCVSERFLRSNPDHFVRFSGVIHLYNAGFEPQEVFNVIKNIGWIDFDPSITKKMLKQIWERGYSEPPCKTIMKRGLCVHGPGFEDFSDDPKDCEVYDWKSGECMWK